MHTEYITLTQFLKLIDQIHSGGAAKAYLLRNDLLVNDQKEQRRGRKLFPGDKIKIDNQTYFIDHVDQET